MHIGKVGSKGELFPPKELRDQLDLKPGEPVIFRMNLHQLIVEKYIPSHVILKKPPKTHLSFKEFKQDRHQYSEDAIQ